MTYVEVACRGLIAVVFCASAASKIRSRESLAGFREWLAAMPLVPFRDRPYPALAIVAAEVAVAAGVLVPGAVRLGFLLALVLLALFSAGVYAAIRRGVRQPCRCFGVSVLPLGWPHLARNLALWCVVLTGFASAGTAGGQAAGVAVSLSAALVFALPLIFFDDIVALLREAA